MTEIILNNIKALCELKGISLIELADAIGIGSRYFTKPHEDLSVNLIVKVADYFEIFVGSLFKTEFTAAIRSQIIQGQIKKLTQELKEIEHE